MIKFLNVFNTLTEYQAFSASTEYVQPNVALVKETNVLYYDYGDNKPQVDMSSYKGEFQDISVGGNYWGKSAITKINYISSGITSLNNAFIDWKSLEEVTCEIPSSVTSMESTFQGCESLIKAPEIPSGVKDIINAFRECKSLITAPDIPSGVTKMASIFWDCISLVNAPAVIPSGVTNMESVFNNCRSLVNAPSVIQGSVTNMHNTFYYCSSLVTAPEIPSSVKDMNHTFGFCLSLKELTLLPTTPPTYSDTLYNCPKLESIYVPDESVDAYKTATGWSRYADKFKPLSSKPTE